MVPFVHYLWTILVASNVLFIRTASWLRLKRDLKNSYTPVFAVGIMRATTKQRFHFRSRMGGRIMWRSSASVWSRFSFSSLLALWNPWGYTGFSCEEYEFPCSINQCLNGGTCYNLTNTQFFCFCVEGFKGDLCETVDDNYSSEDEDFHGCYNGGHREDNGTCICIAPWIGKWEFVILKKGNSWKGRNVPFLGTTTFADAREELAFLLLEIMH